MSVVGIDLGTTNTVVASVRAGKVHVLADERGERLLPSVVSFHPNGEVLVGSAARARRIIDPKNTISSHKRLIGRAWGSPEFVEARQRLTFELREGPGQAPVVHARAKTYTLPEISAFVLKRARQMAETALGEPVTKAVITVPAHFNELQRASTKSAGRISGLDVLRILNEPTAAALAYGLGRTGSERVAVYDFGGGTFDCTLLNLNGNVFEVLATAGDTFLGGDDLDVQIAERMAETLLRQERVDVRTDASLFGRMRAAAEEMKIALSTAESHTVFVSEIAHGLGGSDISFRFTMTRKELDELAKPLLDRTFKVTEEALALARLTPTAFDKVLLVGGSTRIPAVRARVESYFGRKPLDRVNPDEVVSIGAAIQAAALNEGSRRRSIPPPPGVLSAQPRPTSSALPAVPPSAPSSPSSQSLPRSATEAGRAALLADVARRAPKNKATNPGLGAVAAERAEEGARARAKSFTNEVPGGVFGAVPDLPIVAADPSSPRGAAPTTPDEAPILDLPVVKAESDPALPTASSSFADLPAVKADRGRRGGEEITATFTLKETSDGPTLASKTLPGGSSAQPLQRTQRMAPHPPAAHPTMTDTSAHAPGPPPAPAAPAAAPARPPAASAPHLPPMRPPAPSIPAVTAPVSPEPARVPSLPPVAAPPVSPNTAPLPKFQPPPPAPVTAPLPTTPGTRPSHAPSRPPSLGPSGTLALDALPFGLAAGPSNELRAAAPVLVDVTPRALVVETAGGFTDTIIPRNAKIPCEQTHKFATGSAMQTSVRIRVAQGENAVFAQNTFLGEAELSGLRPAPRGEVVIAVTFEVDTDGTVRVRARDVQTGQETHASLKLVGIADDTDIAAMTQRLSVMPMGAS